MQKWIYASAFIHDSLLMKEIEPARQVDWLKKPYTAIPKFSRIFSPTRSVNELHSFPLDCKCLPSRNALQTAPVNRLRIISSVSNNIADVSTQKDSENIKRHSKFL